MRNRSFDSFPSPRKVRGIVFLSISMPIILTMTIFFMYLLSSKVRDEGYQIRREIEVLRSSFLQTSESKESEDTSEVHQETQKSINDARTKIEEVEKRIIDFVGSVRRISGFVHTLLFLCLISSIITILGIQRNLKLTEKETAEIRKQLGEFNELKIEMTNILEEKNELQYKIERLEKLLRLANEAKENNEKKIDLLKEELHMLREKAERLETENNRYYATNVELEKQIRLLQTKLEDNEKPS